ncbi:2-hydroxychromene-2-carboxylate isomerase [Aquirhabdus parva]|uniref:2-hydroxychromene-2-carboxylate isomerase n=2 Tax=Aquirhabdus parva TaxID=2283318 RepID=A0A345PBH6_9GAMM|nr:2-hydroxychromene-2-carboxylate isomerase [Aquirhabdus parva]
MTHKRSILFWFDFASTYSYPAAMRIATLADSSNIQVIWRPFLLGAIFQQQGWNDSPFNIYPAKGAYMWRDMARLCMRENLDFKRPTVFPRNGLMASRIVCANHNELWIPAFVRHVFQANFKYDLNIADLDVITKILNDLDLDADKILNQIKQQEIKNLLRQQTDEAIQSGVFGAPSFIVEGELFWGNDQLEHALDWCIDH